MLHIVYNLYHQAMDQIKANILKQNINKIIDHFQLDEQFWNELEQSNIFPNEYIECVKNQTTEILDNRKKNFLIDLIRRESGSYEKFSSLLRKLYNDDILDHYIDCQRKEAYPMVSDIPGICLIVNNEKFNSVEYENRKGSQLDVDRFKELFTALKYNVIVASNLTKRDLEKRLKDLSENAELKKHDILVAIFMSHGVSDHLVTTDGEWLHYDTIQNFFANEKCSYLKGKPKIFIFNCCRVASHSNSFSLKDTKFGTFADMMVIYSTLNHYYSARDTTQGTLFAQAFVKAMEQNSNIDVPSIVRNASNILDRLENQIEPRQGIEQQTKGSKKVFYFCKAKQ